MSFNFARFQRPGLDEDFVEYLLQEEFLDRNLHFQRLWSYYRNEVHGLEGG